MNELPTSLIDLQNLLKDAHAYLKNLKKEHAAEVLEQETYIKGIATRIALHVADLDPVKVALAESAFYFSGDPRDCEDGHDAIHDALNIIASQEDPLATEYIGLKHYDRWRGQRSDHTYGMGPRHGSIMCSIGRRNRVHKPTPEQREAALYFLHNWGKILDARKKAAQEAASASAS